MKKKKLDWSFMTDERFMQLVKQHAKRWASWDKAYERTAEDIVLKLKGPTYSAKQIRNRYVYLKSKLKFKSKLKTIEVRTENNSNPQQEKINKEELHGTTMYSTLLYDANGEYLDLSKWAYSILDGKKLSKSIKKLHEIQQDKGNNVSIRKIISHLANYFNVDATTLGYRYYNSSKSKKTETTQYINKSEEHQIQVFKDQIEVLNNTVNLERNAHLKLKEQITEQAILIQQLKNQSIINFIKMKIRNCFKKFKKVEND